MQKLTIYEVARRADVSISSVSRVLQGKPGVAPAKRKRVLAAVKALGYVPNGLARGLASRRHGVIGLIFPDLDDPSTESGHETLLYSDEVIRGAERAARATGYAFLIMATHGSGGREIARTVGGRVDGLVVLARSLAEPDLAELARRVPIVLLAAGRRARGTDHVSTDNEGGARAVTEHLVHAHGYRDVIFAGGPATSADARARFVGFRTALAAASLPVPDRPAVRGDFSEAGGHRVAAEILRRPTLPRAIAAGNDQIALGLISDLAAAGVAVPGDVAVTGFDDIQLARLASPRLTTVHQPMRDLGAQCVSLLLERLSGDEGRPRAVVLPTELVVRESCGCRATRPARVPVATAERS
ncbi:MAG: LacI family transcriptional regulator [Candidatus Dormibacteraeota bacterium]|nr:LacI family transcriptional regulator [Candidatus Dormibacteraeota bacterium]